MRKKKYEIRELCLMGVSAAILAILAQISILMPFGVPMTMQTFAIMLIAILLGPRLGATTTLIYVFLGAMGLPVFSGFTGGFQRLVGPTGGFLLSFPLMAWMIGLGTVYRTRCRGIFIGSLILANLLNLLCGALMYAHHGNLSLRAALVTCVLPLIPVTIIKMTLASLLAFPMRKRLQSILP